MDKKIRAEAASAANALLLNVAIRALMRSHPNAVALREAWDMSVAEVGRAMLAGYAGSMTDTSLIAEEFQRQKEAMEREIPPVS